MKISSWFMVHGSWQKSICLFVFCLIVMCGCQNKVLHKETRVMMGTFVDVISLDDRAPEIVFKEIKRVEGLLSKYIPQSEISRLNKFGELIVSTDTMYVLKRANEFYLASDGAFDVTVAPLVDLWGFTNGKFRLPKTNVISETLKRVGMDKIIFNDENNVVKFKLPGMSVDLGGIAKGYAVDCAVKKLKEAGIKNCLINAGGQIYALGDKFGKPWKVAIRNPRTKAFVGYLNIRDQAVSTSGDYEQYFLNNKKRYSHIFDPRTGYPAQSGIIAVTVVAPDGLTADALTTAIFVLGKSKAAELTKKFSASIAKIVTKND